MSDTGFGFPSLFIAYAAGFTISAVIANPDTDININIPDTLKQHALSGNASDPAQRLVCESAQDWATQMNASLKNLSKTGKALEVEFDPAKCAEFLPVQSVDAPQPAGG